MWEISGQEHRIFSESGPVAENFEILKFIEILERVGIWERIGNKLESFVKPQRLQLYRKIADLEPSFEQFLLSYIFWFNNLSRIILCMRQISHRFSFFSSTYTNVWMRTIQMA